MSTTQNLQDLIKHFELDAFFSDRATDGAAEGKNFAAVAFSGHTFEHFVTMHATEAEALAELNGLNPNDYDAVAVVDLATGSARKAIMTVQLGESMTLTAVEV